MRTIGGPVRIPARRSRRVLRLVTCGMLLAVGATACGSDDDSTGTVVTDTTAASNTETSATSSAPTTATQPTVTIATVGPQISASTVPESTTTAEAPNEAVISVTVGVDSGADRVESIPLGATVTLTLVNPGSADEFHAHGYDLGDGTEIPVGEPATFTFVADQAGEFEVESHATDQVLVVLDVG